MCYIIRATGRDQDRTTVAFFLSPISSESVPLGRDLSEDSGDSSNLILDIEENWHPYRSAFFSGLMMRQVAFRQIAEHQPYRAQHRFVCKSWTKERGKC